LLACVSILVVVAGCGEDLGNCDMAAATQVVYAPDGTPYYAGQALVQSGCSNGVCHSAAAVGMGRQGAPHYLNFDLNVLTPESSPANIAQLRSGLSTVRDEASEMYEQLNDDLMPPGKAGERTATVWKLANGQAAAMPDIRSAEGKSTVRNWLSCVDSLPAGPTAPVVAGITNAPADAMTLGAVKPPLEISGGGATFDDVFNTVLAVTCVTCHKAGGPYVDQTPLDFSTKDTSFATLVGPSTSATGSCVGKGKLVTAGNCDTSILYEKLQPAPVVCGAPMPFGGTLLGQAQRDLVCNWIKAGATK
jgi:hypothetical protein